MDLETETCKTWVVYRKNLMNVIASSKKNGISSQIWHESVFHVIAPRHRFLGSGHCRIGQVFSASHVFWIWLVKKVLWGHLFSLCSESNTTVTSRIWPCADRCEHELLGGWVVVLARILYTRSIFHFVLYRLPAWNNNEVLAARLASCNLWGRKTF